MNSVQWGYVRIITGTIFGGILGFYVMHRVELNYKYGILGFENKFSLISRYEFWDAIFKLANDGVEMAKSQIWDITCFEHFLPCEFGLWLLILLSFLSVFQIGCGYVYRATWICASSPCGLSNRKVELDSLSLLSMRLGVGSFSIGVFKIEDGN
ncbi:hypothetical protein J1N35_027965 [Gossypium stocksii]|uniref:Uncharacterized protein n=1 Tax=Gossypium stocksii TaxID=47602 RepID=A0A9D3VB32_9ROSI|nr:hypothetical protein J1N35_027965 [Gossypium stocksii]